MSSGPTVLHINGADNVGGAGRAVFRTHTGLLRAGWDSRVLTGLKVKAGHPEIKVVPRRDNLFRKGTMAVVQELERATGLEYQLLPVKREFLNHPFTAEAEIIHLHNLHGGYFPFSILPKLARNRPMVLTIHDLWPLTGHCYFPGLLDCTRWKSGCGQCPGLRQNDYYPLSIDTTRYLWRKKKSVYSRCDLTVIAQTRWSRELIRASPLLNGFECRTIPSGLDTELFRPVGQEMARKALGIREDARVLFFCALDPTDERKGWRSVQLALSKFKADFPQTVVLLCAGVTDANHDLLSDLELVNLDVVTNDRLMVLAYNAADLFVCGSLMETLGQTLTEAMACGVPVVAFENSGIRDVVIHMETGYLAADRDIDDFAKGISLLLEDDNLRVRMAAGSRAIALNEYSLDVHARRLISLYRDLLKRPRA